MRWAVAPTGLRFRRRVAEELKRVEANVLSTKDMDPAKLASLPLKTILKLLDALPETIPDLVELRRDMDTCSLVCRAISRRRHRRKKRRTDPVRKLDHRMVLAVPEHRQLGQTVVLVSVRAEVPCE